MVDPNEAVVARMLAAQLDRGGERSLSHQIADGIWAEFIEGTLRSGQRLPTVRQLAIDLAVHPRVVERAYDELDRRGIVSRQPDGVFLSFTDADPGARERGAALEAACREAVTTAEALGFSIEDVMEALTDLRVDRASRQGS